MSAPLNYTQAIPEVMDQVSRRTQAITTLVDELDRLITPFVAASAGTAFTTLQEVVATWKGGAGEHTATEAAYVRAGNDSYTGILAADRQASGFFQA